MLVPWMGADTDVWSVPIFGECDEAPLCPPNACALAWGDGNEKEGAFTPLGKSCPPAHLVRALSLTGTLDSREHMTGTRLFSEPTERDHSSLSYLSSRPP